MKKLVATCILFLTTSCVSLQPPQLTREPDPEPIITQAPSPELTWDHNPETLIIQVFSSGGGSLPNTALANELFVAQIWGDGRIVWTTWGENFQRQV